MKGSFRFVADCSKGSSGRKKKKSFRSVIDIRSGRYRFEILNTYINQC
jgi:hypothetical protein